MYVRHHGRVDRPVPAAVGLVHDRHDLPGPSRIRVLRPSISEFARKAHSHWPMPLRRNAHAGADMIAYPLHSMAVLLGCKDVEADFRPIVNTFGQLDRFVLL